MKKVIYTFALLFMFFFSFSQYSAFEVKVTGSGQPIILIPGYSCSGAVWNETVEHLKGNYQLHVLTLAGFSTARPIQNEEILATVKDQIIQYVKDQNMQKPILIGHSLGAFMALWLESSAPDLFGKAICVDGVPFVSAIGNPNATEESVKSNPQFDKATTIKNFENLPNENYVENMTRAMLYQVSDSIRAKEIATWSFQSDRRTLGSTIIEMATTDLRDDIAKIKSPVLVLTSIFGTKEASEKVYNTQYALLLNKTIKVADSKHFIMYDVPEWFYQQVDEFLNAK